jgi:hypothetical protein
MKVRIASYFHRHSSTRFFAPFRCLLSPLFAMSLSPTLVPRPNSDLLFESVRKKDATYNLS